MGGMPLAEEDAERGINGDPAALNEGVRTRRTRAAFERLFSFSDRRA